MLETSMMTFEEIEAKVKADDSNLGFESSEDLQNMLDGMVVMRKLKKVGERYGSIDLAEDEEDSKPRKKRNESTEFKYPEFVTTDKDKIHYLLSPDAPVLNRPMTIMYFDVNKSQTGRDIYDAINSSTITHEVCIAGDRSKNCNVTIYNRQSTSARGFGISIREGKFRVYISDANSNVEKFFDSYAEMREWIVKNL